MPEQAKKDKCIVQKCISNADKLMEKAKEDYKKAAKKLDAAIKENERMEKLSRISLNSII